MDILNLKTDCWIIIDDKIYDMSQFLYEHPGGQKAIRLLIGKDATNHFYEIHHKSLLQEQYVQDMVIGTVKTKMMSKL